MMEPLTVILALVAALLAAILVTMLARGGLGRDGGGDWQMLAGQVRQLADTQASTQAALAGMLNERLDAVAGRVGETLAQSTERTGKALADLQARLAVIDTAQASLNQLSSQVIGLQDILNNKQARGAFGEVQLDAIVRDALPASAYALQADLGNGRRVDCLIRLPNPPGSIAIDAKFPLEGYRALRAATDDAARLQAGRAFSADVLRHVNDIAEKYIVPGVTAESALMFLPSEAVYAELHASFASVVEQARRRRVWIVSPTTLMATLTTVRAILKDARMREQAHVIQKEVLLLVEDVSRLADRVDNLKKHFGQAEKDIREIETSAAKIVRKAVRIEELQIEDGEASEAAAAPAIVPPAKIARAD